MKATRIACLLGAATLVLAHAPAAACGDKLSMMGGGVSFELVNPTRHRGNVVLFVTPDSPLRLSKREQTLEKTLRRAGHTVRVVNSPAELASALQAGNVDIVLTDAQEATPRPIATGPEEPCSSCVAGTYLPASRNRFFVDFAKPHVRRPCRPARQTGGRCNRERAGVQRQGRSDQLQPCKRDQLNVSLRVGRRVPGLLSATGSDRARAGSRPGQRAGMVAAERIARGGALSTATSSTSTITCRTGTRSTPAIRAPTLTA